MQIIEKRVSLKEQYILQLFYFNITPSYCALLYQKFLMLIALAMFTFFIRICIEFFNNTFLLQTLFVLISIFISGKSVLRLSSNFPSNAWSTHLIAGALANNERIRLEALKVITLYHGRLTNGRRSAPVPQVVSLSLAVSFMRAHVFSVFFNHFQLQCVGGTAGCSAFTPQVVQCRNMGSDGYDVQWECKTDMSNKYRFGRIDVNCEGYDYPNDPFILRGSCGVSGGSDFLFLKSRTICYLFHASNCTISVFISSALDQCGGVSCGSDMVLDRPHENLELKELIKKLKNCWIGEIPLQELFSRVFSSCATRSTLRRNPGATRNESVRIFCEFSWRELCMEAGPLDS